MEFAVLFAENSGRTVGSTARFIKDKAMKHNWRQKIKQVAHKVGDTYHGATGRNPQRDSQGLVMVGAGYMAFKAVVQVGKLTSYAVAGGIAFITVTSLATIYDHQSSLSSKQVNALQAGCLKAFFATRTCLTAANYGFYQEFSNKHHRGSHF